MKIERTLDSATGMGLVIFKGESRQERWWLKSVFSVEIFEAAGGPLLEKFGGHTRQGDRTFSRMPAKALLISDT